MSERLKTASAREVPASGPAGACSGRHPAGVLPWRGRAVPNLLVLFALGGLAWWGHDTGWKLPRFSELAGRKEGGQDDWCAEHAVPETICAECNPGLLPRPTGYG